MDYLKGFLGGGGAATNNETTDENEKVAETENVETEKKVGEEPKESIDNENFVVKRETPEPQNPPKETTIDVKASRPVAVDSESSEQVVSDKVVSKSENVSTSDDERDKPPVTRRRRSEGSDNDDGSVDAGGDDDSGAEHNQPEKQHEDDDNAFVDADAAPAEPKCIEIATEKVELLKIDETPKPNEDSDSITKPDEAPPKTETSPQPPIPNETPPTDTETKIPVEPKHSPETEPSTQSVSKDATPPTGKVPDVQEVQEDVQVEDDDTEEGDEEDEEEVSDSPDPAEQPTNPAYIPRTGVYFQHDLRNETLDSEDGGKPLQKPSRAEKKWTHDFFNERAQAPKSARELVKRYGYDIRSGEEPPPEETNVDPEIQAQVSPVPAAAAPDHSSDNSSGGQQRPAQQRPRAAPNFRGRGGYGDNRPYRGGPPRGRGGYPPANQQHDGFQRGGVGRAGRSRAAPMQQRQQGYNRQRQSDHMHQDHGGDLANTSHSGDAQAPLGRGGALPPANRGGVGSRQPRPPQQQRYATNNSRGEPDVVELDSSANQSYSGSRAGATDSSSSSATAAGAPKRFSAQRHTNVQSAPVAPGALPIAVPPTTVTAGALPNISMPPPPLNLATPTGLPPYPIPPPQIGYSGVAPPILAAGAAAAAPPATPTAFAAPLAPVNNSVPVTPPYPQDPVHCAVSSPTALPAAVGGPRQPQPSVYFDVEEQQKHTRPPLPAREKKQLEISAPPE